MTTPLFIGHTLSYVDHTNFMDPSVILLCIRILFTRSI